MPSCTFFPALYASYLFCVLLFPSLSLSPSLSGYVYLGLCRCYVVIYRQAAMSIFSSAVFCAACFGSFFLFVFAFSTNLTFVLLWSTSRPAASSLSTPLLLSLLLSLSVLCVRLFFSSFCFPPISSTHSPFPATLLCVCACVSVCECVRVCVFMWAVGLRTF